MRFISTAVVCSLLLGVERAAGASSQDVLARRRRLKALAEKEKIAADPRGAQRERQRRISQHRNLREGVTIKEDYYERRELVKVKGTIPVSRKLDGETIPTTRKLDGKEAVAEGLAFWQRIFETGTDMSVTNAPVAPPTKAPTSKPTVNEPLTASPTEAPVVTGSPTKAPTLTRAPTKAPVVTEEPTSSPTRAPTLTDSPTRAPVVTASPTRAPVVTASPTSGPTKAPTVTGFPTRSPVVTASPTSGPTRAPALTALPTGAPVVTSSPTRGPTKFPTNSPTRGPTKIPTNVPTRAPVVTGEPTRAPVVTSNPTKAPTKFPTRAPTSNPTKAPTKFPTNVPTQVPTKSPTRVPTRSPTRVPTLAPTSVPTASPTMCMIEDILLPVALFGGVEFEDPDTYQSKALAFLCSSDTSGLSDDRIIQRYSLASIYYATNNVSTPFTDIAFGPGLIFPWSDEDNWVTDANECDWIKVQCDSANNVILLDLFSNLVTGEFPPEVSILKGTLQILDVGTNQVFTDGNIFNEYLGRLTELVDLRYDDTNFQNNPGVPAELANLKKLGFYNAARTLYRGPLSGASFPSDLTELYWIELDFNGFNSSIPLEIGLLPNLTSFFIRDCFMDGDLAYLETAPKIRTNWVDINPGLRGPLPTFLGTLSTLGSFSVTECNFDSTLPTEFGLLRESMTFAFFYLNSFTGGVPLEWSNLRNLEVLEVQDNLLTEVIPPQICALRFSGLGILNADCEICPVSGGAIPCCTSCVP